MKYLLPLLALCAFLTATPLYAQYTTVKYDPAVNWFNQGQPLPAEQDIIFTGPVPDSIALVEVEVLEAKRRNPLHTSTWRRQAAETEFAIPLNFKLRAKDEYDLQFSYFGVIRATERTELRTRLLENLMMIVATNQKKSNGINFRGSERRLLQRMNEMLERELTSYRAAIASWSPQLSELVAMQLKQMEKLKLSANKNQADSVRLRTEVAANDKTEQLQRLEGLLATEINDMLDQTLFRLRDARIVDNYTTEDKAGGLALNLGYGGVYLSGRWTDGQYGQGPYAGIAIPLGNRVLGARFFRNAAITAGVFFTGLESGESQKVEGFLIEQPLYLSLDYKIFQFVHLNVGTVLLNGNTLQNTNAGSGDQQLTFRPFIGLSARINLRAGLGK